MMIHIILSISKIKYACYSNNKLIIKITTEFVNFYKLTSTPVIIINKLNDDRWTWFTLKIVI